MLLGKALYLTCFTLPRCNGELPGIQSFERRPKVEPRVYALDIVRQLTYSNGSGINVKRFDTCERRYINDDIYFIYFFIFTILKYF